MPSLGAHIPSPKKLLEVCQAVVDDLEMVDDLRVICQGPMVRQLRLLVDVWDAGGV